MPKIPILDSNAFPSFVNAEELDALLEKNRIMAFRRSDGWVRVGLDDMRDPKGRKGSSWKDRKTLRWQRPILQITNS